MYKSVVEGKGGIVAKVVADSLSPAGKRITTFELEYPRFIHCFDEQTEILCKTSEDTFPIFRKFSEVSGKEDVYVAQVNKDTFEVSFVKPERWIESKEHSEVVTFENQRLNFSVTGGHRLLVGSRKQNRYEKEVILAKELTENFTTKRFYKSGSLSLSERSCNISPDLAELIGYFIGDGHVPLKGKQGCFHFRKARKINRVRELLITVGYDFSETQYGKDTVFRIRKSEWMDRVYTEEGEKCIPEELFGMSEESFQRFKKGLLESDGCVSNNDYNTLSKTLIEQMQSLFHVNKESFNIRQYGNLYKVKFLKEDSPVMRKDKQRPVVTKYFGTVYCVSVPESFVMVRRKGIVHISGNCEFMTHRMLSRNAASSRAIPVNKMLEKIQEGPAMPIHWGKNQPGMSAKEENDSRVSVGMWKENNSSPKSYRHVNMALTKTQAWQAACNMACDIAKEMSEAGYHKQIVNRLTEPYQFMKVVATATEWSNFFYLRCHADAQPEIKELADCMERALKESIPEQLEMYEWHLPYIQTLKFNSGYGKNERLYCLWVHRSGETTTWEEISLEDAIKISASCCAQVSYRNMDTSLEKALKIYKQLVENKPVHASPFEHQATPMEYFIADSLADLSEAGVTHISKDLKMWSGNLCGWVQHRQLIPNHVVW